MTGARQYMPIMTPDVLRRHPFRAEIDAPILQRLPMAMFTPHEKQAQTNHGQSLDGLAARGGLSACEAVAILEDRPWRRMSLQDACATLFELSRAPADVERIKVALRPYLHDHITPAAVDDAAREVLVALGGRRA